MANVQEEDEAFLMRLSEKNEEVAVDVAQLIAKIILFASGKETAWVVLRGWRPTNMFDVPRWHRDVPVLDKDGYKFAIALKGSTTMFVRVSDSNQDLYVELARELSWIMTEYATKDERSTDGPNVVHAPAKAVAMFEAGHNGAIHAEPPIHEPRLFLSVFCESKEEIEKLAEAFGEFKKSGAMFF